MVLATDIGGAITPSSTIVPQSLSGTTVVNGTAVDRAGTSGDQEYLSGVMVIHIGAATGSPSSFTVDCKLQDSPDTTSGNFADIASSVGGPIAMTQQTAGSVMVSVSFNAKMLRRYIRAVATPSFSGGTSPTVPIGVTLVLGGANKKPTP